MRIANDLSRDEAIDIVAGIVDAMYLDFDSEGDYYNPDKSLDGADFIENVAAILSRHGLAPDAVQRLA